MGESLITNVAGPQEYWASGSNLLWLTMLSIVGLYLLLLAPQLNPALTPQTAPKPALPKIDQNACPFEGCQFGPWTAREQVQLFSTWKSGRKQVATISKGEKVTAITGVHVTAEPSESQITTPIPQYGLKPGDIIFGYMNLGEGVFNAWFNGYWVEDFDGSGIDGLGCSRKCNAKLIKPGRFEWWVEIKTKNGGLAWTRDGDKFDGTDALGGSD